MFQLMRGGTDPRFRVRPSLEVLELIKQCGIMPVKEVEALQAAYVYLRRLEHRIQIWDDQQTHYLPEDEEARSRLAISMQDQDANDFMGQLEHHQNNVSQTQRRQVSRNFSLLYNYKNGFR